MSLDTKQKRGSAMSMALPFRRWISDPAEDLADASSQLSVLRLCSDPIPAGAIPDTPDDSGNPALWVVQLGQGRL